MRRNANQIRDRLDILTPKSVFDRSTPMAKGAAIPRDGRGEILALTGLRGVAALLIAIYHISFLNRHDGGRINVFMEHGYLWADLFFVLSGFIMGTTYRRIRLTTGWRAYRGFLWRRLARIYPLYAMTTLAAFVLFQNDFTWWRQALSHPVRVLALDLTMLQSLHLAPSLDPPAWSISTEWVAYLLFPALCSATLGQRTWLALAAGVVAVAVLVDIAFGYLPPPPWQAGSFDVTGFLSGRPVARCVSEFALGLLACRWHAWARPFSSTVVGLVIAVLMAFRGTDLAIVLLLPVLVMSLLRERDLLSRALGSRLAVWLGRISYALYLLHMPLGALRLNLTVTASIQRMLPSVSPTLAFHLATVLLYVGVLGTAWASFLFFEQPVRRWLLRLLPATPKPESIMN